MFKKSKVKIVALIMTVLVALLAGIIALIYLISYSEINSQNREMLQNYAEAYAKYGVPTGPIGGDFEGTRRFQLSTFYSVSFTPDGEALDINNDSGGLFTDEELTDFAARLLGQDYGTTENIAYLITGDEAYTLVTMMDNTIIDESYSTLISYTLIFGGIAVPVLLLVSVMLSGWIIRPLEEAYSKQKQFISDAGHELKTPIATISANAELLARTLDDSKWLNNIQYENKRMSYIVHQLLDLTKVENAQVILENIDFGRVVLAATLPFEGIAYERGLEFTYSVQEDIHIDGDSKQIGELLSILLDNAFQHSIENGSVAVSMTASHNTASLIVRNQGQEIPPEQQDKIFERFYRADTVRNSESKRYGLGLAIAKAIVLAHHGRVSITCTDGYTSFIVTIPQKRSASAQ